MACLYNLPHSLPLPAVSLKLRPELLSGLRRHLVCALSPRVLDSRLLTLQCSLGINHHAPEELERQPGVVAEGLPSGVGLP